MRRSLFAVLTVAAFWLPPSLVLADAEAERIRDGLLSVLGGEGSVAVAADPRGAGYRVTLSGLSLPGAGGETQALGDIAFLVQRQGDDYAFEQVDLPNSLSTLVPVSPLLGLEEGLSALTLTAKWQQLTAAGVWSPALQSPTDLDLSLGGLVLTLRPEEPERFGLGPDEQARFTLSDVGLTLSSDRKAPSDWDITVSLQLGPLEGSFPDLTQNPLTTPSPELRQAAGFPDTMTVKVASAFYRLDVTGQGFNPESYGQLRQALSAYATAAESGDLAALERIREQILDLERVLHGLDIAWDSQGVSYEEDWPGGLRFAEAVQKGRTFFEAPAGSDSGRFGYSGTGNGKTDRRAGLAELYALRNEGAAANLQDSVFALLPLTRRLELLAPTQTEIALFIERIPVRQTSALLLHGLAYTLASAAAGETAEPVDLSKAAPQAYADWIAAVEAVKTRILLQTLAASGPLLWFDAKADVEIDPESESGLVGSAEISLSDIDKAVKAARKQVTEELGLDPTDKESSSAQIDAALTLGLAFLKGLGDLSAKNGQIVYRYRFEFPAAAPATLNDKPLSRLFGG